MIRTLAAPALALALVVAAPACVSAQTVDCTWYAQTALKQQQRNDQGKCGFTGPEWNPSLQVHLAWCSTQDPDRWKAQAQKREQTLAGCGR